MRRVDWHRVRVLAVAGFIALLPSCAILISALAPICSDVTAAENAAIATRKLQYLTLEKPVLKKKLAQAQGRLSRLGVLYGGGSSELASAQLQNTLQDLVARSGGQVQTSAILTPQSAHGLEILSVSASFTLPSGQLAGFLTSVEAQKPCMIIQGIDLRSSYDGNQIAPLNIQLQVIGFGSIIQ